jgi:hypothetical protein
MLLEDIIAQLAGELDATRTRLETTTLRHNDELRMIADDLRSLRRRIISLSHAEPARR